jgi:hypothetical protein
MTTTLEDVTTGGGVTSLGTTTLHAFVQVNVTTSATRINWYTAEAQEYLPTRAVLISQVIPGRGQRRKRRQQFRDAFSRLKADPARWAAYQADFNGLDGTIADGLSEDEGEVWDESLVDSASW